MRKRRRNRMFVWIIAFGMFNFLMYTVSYAYIGGDAKNGKIVDGHCYVRGHFLHSAQGTASEVSGGVWIYSYLHSITIWPTIGLVLCTMLILARPHIISTMSEDSYLQGTTFVTMSMTVVVIATGASTLIFVIDFIRALDVLANGGTYGL